MIYTSYYGNPLLDRTRHFLVPVSNTVPKNWSPDASFTQAIPEWDTIVRPHKDGRIDEETFTFRYRMMLDCRKDAAIAQLRNIVQQADTVSMDVILLCWERPGTFCHRRILAEWLLENTQIDVPELPNDINGNLFD